MELLDSKLLEIRVMQFILGLLWRPTHGTQVFLCHVYCDWWYYNNDTFVIYCGAPRWKVYACFHSVPTWNNLTFLHLSSSDGSPFTFRRWPQPRASHMSTAPLNLLIHLSEAKSENRASRTWANATNKPCHFIYTACFKTVQTYLNQAYTFESFPLPFSVSDTLMLRIEWMIF